MMTSSLIVFTAQSNINLKLLLRREYKDFNDTIMIETPFIETTRDGKNILRNVRLALTSRTFVIASGKDGSSPRPENQFYNDISEELLLLYPWHSVKLYVFKKSKRKCIKALYLDNSTRYFQLQDIPKMQIHWYLWCRYIIELHNSTRRWPFAVLTKKNYDVSIWHTQCTKISVVKYKKKIYSRPQWTDKYLYLGSIREVEDQIRPRPMPGLGKTKDIKLLYLKPRYFGCWEQSEHWVQCGESLPDFAQGDDY